MEEVESSMRKHLVWFLAAVMAVSVAGYAWARADTETSKASIKISPTKLSKTKFKNIKISVETSTLSNSNPGTPTNPGTQPGATKDVKLTFDDDIKFDTKGIPQCKANLEGTTPQQADAKCGKATVGSGSATACLGNPCTPLAASVRAYNGKPQGGNPTIVLHSYIQQLAVTTVLTGTLKSGGKGDFNKVLDVPVPNLPAVITDFKTTVGKTTKVGTKKHHYISARCADKNKQLNMRSQFTYSNPGESTDKDSEFAKCST